MIFKNIYQKHSSDRWLYYTKGSARERESDILCPRSMLKPLKWKKTATYRISHHILGRTAALDIYRREIRHTCGGYNQHPLAFAYSGKMHGRKWQKNSKANSFRCYSFAMAYLFIFNPYGPLIYYIYSHDTIYYVEFAWKKTYFIDRWYNFLIFN